MVHRHDISNHPVLEQQFPEQHIMRTVSEDMANGEDLRRSGIWQIREEGFVNRYAVIETSCQWFLTHYMESKRRKSNNDLLVHLLEDANEYAIDSFRYIFSLRSSRPPFLFPSQELFPVLKLLPLCWTGLAP